MGDIHCPQCEGLTNQVAALEAEVERLKAEISFLTVDPQALANPQSHRRNCAAWLNEFGHEVNAEDCTCGYRYRIVLQTEQNIRAAWMKRANEAETERDSAREQLAEHLHHVSRFLTEMYQVMVDPLEEPTLKVAEMCALLLKRATEDREQLRKMQDRHDAGSDE